MKKAYLVVTSDWHIDARTAGVRRHADLEMAVTDVQQAAISLKEEGHDVGFLFLGDLCDPDSRGLTFLSQRVAAQAAKNLHSFGIQSFWLVGNHDITQDALCTSTLSFMDGCAGATLIDEPGKHTITFRKGFSLDFLALPFTCTEATYDPAKVASEALCAHPDIRMVIGHLTIPGIQPGEETTDMPRGRDIMFPVEETKDVPLRLNGHYHHQQLFKPSAGGDIAIPGALAQLTFGESDSQPGYLIVEVTK